MGTMGAMGAMVSYGELWELWDYGVLWGTMVYYGVLWSTLSHALVTLNMSIQSIYETNTFPLPL